MGRNANFDILENIPGSPLIIRDIGPWDKHLSVTNDAEGVVELLVKSGFLDNNRRLFCYDSEKELDELVVKDEKFAGFAPVSKEEKSKL
jgi:hypothetical protein